MEIESSYIQYASGYEKDDIIDLDVDKALIDLNNMHDEHGGFWIGVYGANTDEFVIELHKSLNLFGNFGEKENYKINLDKLELAKDYYNLLLNDELDELREKSKNN